MTDKQARFCEEYMVDLNATQAAIRAGYSPASAKTVGPRLLENVGVQKLIAQLQAEQSRRTGVSTDRVVRELAKIAFVNAADLIDPKTASLKSDASHDDLAAVQSVKVKTFGEDGLEQEVKLADKLRALDLLGKHLGMYKDTSEKDPAADALAKRRNFWEAWTVPLTEFQQEYLRNCNHRWNVKTGATRSGKTYLDCAVTIPKRICAARGEGLLVMLGNTLGTLERNVLESMRSLWGPELVGVVRTSASGNIVQLFGHKVYVLGADNKKHIARIQGAAFEYAYGDEITTWDEGVFQMLKSRLSCPHSHFDGTCNPESPSHWFKKFLDSDADIYCQAYTIDDNPTLPAQFVADLKKEYTGTVYYNRFILGQWMAANGVIYRLLADSLAAGDRRFFWPAEKQLHPWRIRIGVDFGGNGSKHAFVATAILPGWSGVVGLASQRIDPVAQDADFLADKLIEFCIAVFARWGEIQYIFCDSAEQTLINHIRSRLRQCRLSWLADRVENSAKIKITDRIRLTCILMGGGRFWLMPEAATLRDALATALYSGKHPGVDERLDDGSTDIDTLDAYEYTIERDFKRLTNT